MDIFVMTSDISNTAKIGPVSSQYAKPLKNRLEESKTQTVPAAAGDKIDFSAEAARLISEPGFDQGKVATIKQAIASGNYPLDAKRIAESFVALEKMISHVTPPDAASGS